MAENIKPTRSELMKLKNRIKLAKSGYSLLKKKRDGLILEFFEILKRAKTVRQELTEEYKRALSTVNIARTVEGDVQISSIMGVVVPKISYARQNHGFDRGYGTVASSSIVDNASVSFENVLSKIVEAAEVETGIKKLLDEIEKTKRRVNALEFEIIPRLEVQRKFIQMRLDEMDRENVFRMKRIKK
jgi:V/A-type H+-transporting ATPase subunit D